MPNRSPTPHDSYIYRSDDIIVGLDDWFDRYPGRWGDVVLWHTHPSGFVGPSEGDLDNRIASVGNLVVALLPEIGTKLTWY